MNHTMKKLPQSQAEIVVTVTPDEYKKHMEKAAQRITERSAIKGFRNGKAPYETVKKEFGEMNILNEALESIVQESFYNAVKAEGLDTIGMPQITVEKMAPGNDVEYKAVVALLPKVTLPEISKIKIAKKAKEIKKEHIDEVLANLSKMQAREVIKNDAASGDDMVEIDMDLKKDGVPVEGGQAKGYKVYLNEKEYHIPGFNDHLVGVKIGDEKIFSLPFPENYHNKMLAGNMGEFSVKVKGVYTREFPTLDDEFAKTLGQENLAKLEERIKENLELEAGQKADKQAEIEIFDTIIEKSTFDEIPEVLIDAERRKMFYELKQDLERNGIEIERYLNDIKKTEKELFEDFKEQATKRAKASLVSRQIAKEKEIVVTDEEVEKELEMLKSVYQNDPDAAENLKRPEVKDTIRTIEQNKKVVAWLKETVLEGEKKEETK